MKWLAVLLVLLGSAHAQGILDGIMNVQNGVVAITADGSPCHATTSGATTLSCGNITASSGDLIWCFWATDNSPSIGSFESVSDSTNGAYTIPQYTDDNNSLNMESEGQAYFANAVSGTYAPLLTMTGSDFGSIECQPFKHVLTANPLDTGAINQLKLQTGSTGTNPTSGSTQLPTSAGELVTCVLQNTTATTPTVGSGYTLLSGPSANGTFGEYGVFSSATNCLFTESADKYGDGSAAFLPTGSTAGANVLTGPFINFEGLSNTVAPTTGTLGSSTFGIPITWATPGANFTGATAGQLSNLITSIFDNGTVYNGSGSLGLQFATGSGTDQVGGTFPPSTHVSLGLWVEWNIPNNDSSGHAYSMVTIQNGGGADYAVIQLQPSGTVMQVRLECKTGVSSNFTVTTSTLYWMTMNVVNSSGTDTLKIYNSSGSLQSTLTCSAESGANTFSNFGVGPSGAESEASGDHIWFDDIEISLIGVYPLGP